MKKDFKKNFSLTSNEEIYNKDSIKKIENVLNQSLFFDKKTRPRASIFLLKSNELDINELLNLILQQLKCEEKRFQFNMSEYRDTKDALVFIRQLEDIITKNNNGSIIINEADKANLSCLNLLLPILDSGYLDLGRGKTIEGFNNFYVFFISEAKKTDQRSLLEELGKKYTIELIKRFDEIVYLN